MIYLMMYLAVAVCCVLPFYFNMASPIENLTGKSWSWDSTRAVATLITSLLWPIFLSLRLINKLFN